MIYKSQFQKNWPAYEFSSLMFRSSPHCLVRTGELVFLFSSHFLPPHSKKKRSQWVDFQSWAINLRNITVFGGSQMWRQLWFPSFMSRQLQIFYDPLRVKDISSLNRSFNQQLQSGSISAILIFTLKIMQMDLQKYYYHKNIFMIIIFLKIHLHYFKCKSCLMVFKPDSLHDNSNNI